MGSWFVNFFAARNVSISVYDRDAASLYPSRPSIIVADKLAACVKNADLVLVCVPVRLAPNVIKECSKFMKHGGTLAEITSVKLRSFPALSRVRKDIVPLCIHPMFGPGATEKTELKMLLVPVRDEQNELEVAQDFFVNIKVVVVPSPRDHDNAIGIVLGLTYFSNLALADFLSSQNLTELDKVSGTTFRLQSILAQSILLDDPELISVLIRDNPKARRHLKQYLKKTVLLSKLASSRDSSKLESEIKSVKRNIQHQVNLEHSYKRLYNALLASEGQKEI